VQIVEERLQVIDRFSHHIARTLEHVSHHIVHFGSIYLQRTGDEGLEESDAGKMVDRILRRDS
jgi:hypothetical protein